MAFDVVVSKTFKPPLPKAERKVKTNICEISFLNKDVELINVPHIFHDL